MPDAIDITNQFPATRERTVLLELLRVARNLQSEGIAVVICGGWVPFLKQLARESETAHSISWAEIGRVWRIMRLLTMRKRS